MNWAYWIGVAFGVLLLTCQSFVESPLVDAILAFVILGVGATLTTWLEQRMGQ
jgi:hypothetical protein